MKITDVRTMLLTGPDQHGVGGIGRTWHVLFVRVDTDAGIYGIGEAGNLLGDRQASPTAASGSSARTRSRSIPSSGRCCPAASRPTTRR